MHAFISSKLDYCNSLLYGIPKYLVCRLQRVQNMAARIVTLTRKFDSITPIMFKLHWLPVHSRIIFQLLLLLYKALNGKAPSYISTLLSHRRCSRSLRSSGQELLTEPGFAVILISKYGIAVFKVQAVCGNFKFYVAVIGEKIVVSRWSASWVLSFLKHDNYAILKGVLKGPKRSP